MKATLTLGDGFVGVSPYPETLRKELSYYRHSMDYNQLKHKREFRATREDLYREEVGIGPDGQQSLTLFTMPGFAKRIKDHLAVVGWDCEIVDNRTPMPEPNFEKAFTGLREYQYELVYNLLMSGGGVLSAATGIGKSHVIKALCNAYSHESLRLRGTPTIVVAVPDKDITRKNYEDLKALLPDREVGLLMSGSSLVSDDIQVVTLDSLHRLNPESVGVVIVDEMHTASADSRAPKILEFAKARFWGVSATPDGRYDGKDKVAEGIFGPVVAHMTYQEGVAAGCLVPLKVFWLDAPEPQMGATSFCKYKMREKRYDYGVFYNLNLNRLIGRIFRSIPDSLQTLGMLKFTKHMEYVLRACAQEHCMPLPEQAHAGTDPKKFPPAEFLHVHAVSSADRKALYYRMKDGEVRKAIATEVYKQGVSFDDLRIVLNLGGGSSEIASKQIPGRASRKVPGKEVAYIVEFRHPWDVKTVKTKAGRTREVPGPVFTDDIARGRIYDELGFEQFNLVSENELPWIVNNSTPTR